MARPWNLVEDAVRNELSAMAFGTKGGIVPTSKNKLPSAVKRAGYGVAAEIRDNGGTVLTSGQYDATNGIHAEIDALNNLVGIYGRGNIPRGLFVLSSDSPCKRCAAVLSAFRTKYNWTVKAPEKKFHSTYAGAYALPDNVLGVVLKKLKQRQIITPDESAAFGQDIGKLIKSWN